MQVHSCGVVFARVTAQGCSCHDQQGARVLSMMYWRSGSRIFHAGTRAWRGLGDQGGCRPPPLVRWWLGRPCGCRPVTLGWDCAAASTKWIWMQWNKPRTRGPATGRFPEQAVWISSHRSRIWSRSRHVVVFMAAGLVFHLRFCSTP